MKAIVSYRSQNHEFELRDDAAFVGRLKDVIHKNLGLPPQTVKLLAKGKILSDEDRLPGSKIMVIASSPESIEAMKTEAQRQLDIAARRASATHTKGAVKSTKKQSSHYRFHTIEALQHLHEPSKAQKYLERLASDRSIQRLMEKHQLSVGLLTEMDPRLYTTHDSKTLGLNKDGGAEILLRLRTDELDGYRDYRGVKSTLIHELVHNRVPEHPRSFWDLFRDWSAEVESWESGSRVSQSEVYMPQTTDSGVEWTGGSKTLGSGTTKGDVDDRESRARAAERRRQ